MVKKEDFSNDGSVVAKTSMNWGVFLFLLVILVAASGVFGSYYYYSKYNNIKNNPNLEAQQENEVLVRAVGKLIELPTDETPTIATIVDKEKLQDQTFFAKVENGDKLLAFTKAMKAILYRPSTNKIIEVAPIVIDQQQIADQNASATTAPTDLKIAYYNGTAIVGLSGQAEKKVLDVYPGYQTGDIINASRKDYRENLIIDLTGLYGKQAEDLALLLGGSVGSMPDDEKRPDADILIISGE